MERLFESARQIRLAIPYARQELIEGIRQALATNSLKDSYIRLVVTRGEGTLGLNPFKSPRPNVFIITDIIELYPPEMYQSGMAVIVAKTLRTSAAMLSPMVKSLNYLNNIMAKVEAIDAGAPEAIMLNDRGNIAEGSGDNLFLVKDGKLLTPDADSGILMGVTRAVVMRIAKRMGITVIEKALTVPELYSADECFMSGTAAEVISVTRVDGKPVGHGVTGPVTKRLHDAFHEFTRSDECEG
jgi:branched-chain amino acid aminotransferase